MHKHWYIFILIILAFASCDEIVEDDLSGKTVVIISPSDSITTSNSQVQFNWDYLDEAEKYRIQVARPDFINVEWLMYDSVTTSNSIVLSLVPGNYQWRIRPENGSSVGSYITRTIEIDSTMDLTNQEVILIYPTDNFITNQSVIDFTWYELYNAEQYSFLIYQDTWNGNLVLPEQFATSPELTLSGLLDGNYVWGVRGESSLTNTQYSYRSLMIDTEEPILSQVTLPQDAASLISPVQFEWEGYTDDGSDIFDSIYVYSSSDLQTIIWKDKVLNDTISHSFDSGTYYWRIRTFDIAGNSSSFSEVRSFSVQ